MASEPVLTPHNTPFFGITSGITIVFQEADAKMRLHVEEIYWRKYLFRMLGEGAETSWRTFRLKGERERKEWLDRKILTPQQCWDMLGQAKGVSEQWLLDGAVPCWAIISQFYYLCCSQSSYGNSLGEVWSCREQHGRSNYSHCCRFS